MEQLAHSVNDLNGSACNRTEFVEQRRTMLQAWADYLDSLRQGNVLPLQVHSGEALPPRPAQPSPAAH